MGNILDFEIWWEYVDNKFYCDIKINKIIFRCLRIFLYWGNFKMLEFIIVYFLM